MIRIKLMCLLLLLCYSDSQNRDSEKEEFCRQVEKCETDDLEVCGIRWEEESEKFHLKIFSDECELMKYGCNVEEKDAYGIINMYFCNQSIPLDDDIDKTASNVSDLQPNFKDCITDCPPQVKNETVCGIRQHGDGFKVRLFVNDCEILKYNCENNFTFNATEHFICKGLDLPESSTKSKLKGDAEDETDFTKVDDELLEVDKVNTNRTREEMQTTPSQLEFFGDNGVSLRNATPKRKRKRKNLVIVDAGMFDNGGNINDTIDNFFSATHIFDMPLKEIGRNLNESTRRMMLRVFGPVVVFKPWVVIPEKVKEDVWHIPTLNSCFHTCPTECPDTYAPVCGQPGISAREPSLMFKNHCLMDAAQCKMRWDNESSTAPSSTYIEGSFIFCLGEALHGLYRFLPLIRTLQHMGRLKKKGKYHIRLRNMRFFNELLRVSPRIQG